MKTFAEQNQELIEFDKIFDSGRIDHCVHRAMLLIKNRQAQMIEEGHQWPFTHESNLRYACEQKIIHRPYGEAMMYAAMRYVVQVEEQAEVFNGIYFKDTTTFGLAPCAQ